MANTISNDDDIIDSRDVIERIEELEAERADLFDGLSADLIEGAENEWSERDEAKELAALKALQDEAEGYSPDWLHGAMLIRDSYFIDYTQELLQDIGDLPKNLPSYIAIDWEQTAENIQIDYTSVEFDGVTYWVR